MENQSEAIHAIAQAGRLRSIVENVPEMTATTVAMHLGADHAEGAILSRPDSVFQRLIEARPAGAALILGLGREKRMIATSAGENALAVLIQERAGPGALGALVAQNFILL